MIRNNWITYQNGNYTVTINKNNGTQIRETLNPDDTEFLPEFPDHMDVKISNRCKYGCKMCHEKSVPDGELSKLIIPIEHQIEKPEGMNDFDFYHRFFKTLTPGTELALGGGAVTEHPDLEKFLVLLNERGILANITVNIREYKDNEEFINKLVQENLVKGIGISWNDYMTTSESMRLWKRILKNPRAVIHIIAGLVNTVTLDEFLTELKQDGIIPKMLVLGYKNYGRAEQIWNKNSDECKKDIIDFGEWLSNNHNRFKLISFDNLALQQLDLIKLGIATQKDFDEGYQGDDKSISSASGYVDLVKEEFAISSTSKERFKLDKDMNIKSIFSKLLEERQRLTGGVTNEDN